MPTENTLQRLSRLDRNFSLLVSVESRDECVFLRHYLQPSNVFYERWDKVGENPKGKKQIWESREMS